MTLMADLYKKDESFTENQPGMVDLSQPEHNTETGEQSEVSQPKLRNDNKRHLLLNRRQLIYGAAGAGVLVASGVGIKKATDAISNAGNNINVLDVDKSSVVDTSTFTELENNALLTEKASINLPYNTIAFANNSDNIACLIPNDTSDTLAKVMIISKTSKKQTYVLQRAVNQASGYDIYDVRANDKAII